MKLGPFSGKDVGDITSLGMEFALSEILGGAFGYWLDKKFGTLPWCLLGGVLIGFCIGFYRIVKVAKERSVKK